MSQIYPWKFDENPTTGSQDIVQTRNWQKSHANAYTNGIRIKTNMSPSS